MMPMFRVKLKTLLDMISEVVGWFGVDQNRKWEKALFASAIRWVSFFLNVAPSPLFAAMISAAGGRISSSRCGDGRS